MMDGYNNPMEEETKMKKGNNIMNDQQLFVLSQIVWSQVMLEAMKAENMQCQHLGQSMTYKDSDFFKLLDEYPIQHNDVLTELRRNQ